MPDLDIEKVATAIKYESLFATKIFDEATRLELDGAVAVLVIAHDVNEIYSGATAMLNKLGLGLPALIPIGYSTVKITPENSTLEDFIGVCFEKIAYMLRSGTCKKVGNKYKNILGENDFQRGRKMYRTAEFFILIALSTNKPELNDSIVEKIIKNHAVCEEM